MAQSIELGVNTFGDVTVDEQGREHSQAQVLRHVVEEAILADHVGLKGKPRPVFVESFTGGDGSLVGTIVGEFVAGGSGLGHVILVAQGSFDTPTVFVALALLCVLGVLLFKAIEMVERRLLGWHASQRNQVGDGLLVQPAQHGAAG